MYLVGRRFCLVFDWEKVLGLKSFICVRVNLLLYEYLGTPLCDWVGGLGI
jgi:hypothetical protein